MKMERSDVEAPTGDELPKNGFDAEDPGFQVLAADGSGIQVSVSETSERLQLLAPFAPWDGKILHAKLLIKAFGNVLLITFLMQDHVAFPWTFR
jgi:aconitate hydratase